MPITNKIRMDDVTLVDKDSNVQANVTMAGLAVEVNNLQYIGDSVQGAVSNVEARLDTTPLAVSAGYPMKIELEIREINCFIKQGDSAVILPLYPTRMQANDWRVCTVSGVGDAYFAVRSEVAAESGVIVVTRIDSLL